MPLIGTSRSAGISFRISRQRDRDLWIGLNRKTKKIPDDVQDELDEDGAGPFSRSQRGRHLIAMGLAAEAALDDAGCELDICETENLEEREVFVEAAVREYIQRKAFHSTIDAGVSGRP